MLRANLVGSIATTELHGFAVCQAAEADQNTPRQPTFVTRNPIVNVSIRIRIDERLDFLVDQLSKDIAGWIVQDNQFKPIASVATSPILLASNPLTSTVTFSLEIDLRAETAVEINDLSPPRGIPRLGVNAIDIEITANVDHQSLTLASKFTARELSETVIHALKIFFHSQPTSESLVCRPRMFKSTRLIDLAPEAFVPDLPSMIGPRQRLLCSLGRILAKLNLFSPEGIRSRGKEPCRDARTRSVSWFENRLWVCMVRSLRLPRFPKSQRLATSRWDKGTPQTSDCSTEIPPQNDGGKASEAMLAGTRFSKTSLPPPISSALHSIKAGDDLDDLLLQDEEGSRLTRKPPPLQIDADSVQLIPSLSDEGIQLVGRAHRDCTDWWSIDELGQPKRAASILRNEPLYEHVSHLAANGKAGASQGYPCKSTELIGQNKLTHTPSFAELHFGSVSYDDILIHEEFESIQDGGPPPMLWLKSNVENNDLLLERGTEFNQAIDCDSDSDLLSSSITSTEMSPSQSGYRLSEVLGGDHLLRRGWRRKSSVALAGHGAGTGLHNMFANDPDMKILGSREELPAAEDIILFDSFDFSRKTSHGTDMSTESYNDDPGLNLAPDETSSVPKTGYVGFPLRHSIDEPWKASRSKRRQSVLQKLTNPPRMSEDDIIFQQRSPTRHVDIKKRKTVVKD